MIETIYTLDEVSKILKVNRRTAYKYVAQKTLKGFQLGGYWRVTESSLKDFIENGGTNK